MGRRAANARSYFGARYYRAEIGRFTTIDPELNIKDALVEPQRWNRYAYVTNNPLRFTDPDGRDRMGIYAYGFKQTPWRGLWEEVKSIGAVAAVFAAPVMAPELAQAAVGCFLSPACQQTALDLMAPEGSGGFRATGDVDRAAGDLAKRIGGKASVAIQGFGNREFDAVSERFVAQTTGSAAALLKPDNFLSASKKSQIRATLEAAKATGREALFEFRKGVDPKVVDFIKRNAERVGVVFHVQ